MTYQKSKKKNANIGEIKVNVGLDRYVDMNIYKYSIVGIYVLEKRHLDVDKPF